MKGTLVVIAAVVILAVSFLLFTDIGPVAKKYSSIKVHVTSLVGPALKGVSAPFRFTQGIFEGYVDLVHVKKKNGELQKKNGSPATPESKTPGAGKRE